MTNRVTIDGTVSAIFTPEPFQEGQAVDFAMAVRDSDPVRIDIVPVRVPAMLVKTLMSRVTVGGRIIVNGALHRVSVTEGEGDVAAVTHDGEPVRLASRLAVEAHQIVVW